MVNSMTVQQTLGMGFSLLLHWLGFRQSDVNGCDGSRGLTVRAWLGLALVLLLAQSSACSAWSLVRRQWEQTQTRPQLPRQLPSQSGHSGVRQRSMSWAREYFVPQHFTTLTCFVTHSGGNSWLIQIGTVIVSIISCLGVGPREMEALASGHIAVNDTFIQAVWGQTLTYNHSATKRR